MSGPNQSLLFSCIFIMEKRAVFILPRKFLHVRSKFAESQYT
ncbi:hypothetical protein B4099_2773 [Heyndrickxia coagulans]|uniref:Uncharacterized protein n=1 Tax=Heyndrickxia coagulans TaxID=1398 RepID=A0A150KIZ6_HEYCO|nr:hypothetical protein B4099_2773 [Heyndrickxia coagulans]